MKVALYARVSRKPHFIVRLASGSKTVKPLSIGKCISG